MIDIEKESNKFINNFDKMLILLCESGSGTYGFRSDDSDLDLRGVFVEDIDKLLSLRPPRDTIDGFSDDRMIDWQIFELKKFLGLLTKPNFNVLEWVYTPLQVMEFPKEIHEIADMSLSQKLGNHVRGWAYSIYKMDWRNPKKCLYAIRPLMSYINLCERKEFVSDITILSPRFGLEDHVDTLIELYRSNRSANDMVRAKNLKIYEDFAESSNEIEKSSWLPDKTDDIVISVADEFLINARLNRQLIGGN
jgi:predicted nucleotidyltransferase